VAPFDLVLSTDTRSASSRTRFLRRRKNIRPDDAERVVNSLLRVRERTHDLPARRQELDVESRAWIDGLRATGVERARALDRLHDLLLHAARAEAHRRRHLYPEIVGVELDDLCRQAADDAVVAVTAKLDGYRGASLFTTWAYAFAIFEVSVRLRRHAWRRGHIPTTDDDATWDRLAERAGTAEARVETAELFRALRHAITEELTARQRQVFVAVALNDVEIDVVADQLSSTRGAVYKVLHDARAKLRHRLEREGHLNQERAR
jgi:RNA polymerase sigma-70 factor (ECF subfamily)